MIQLDNYKKTDEIIQKAIDYIEIHLFECNNSDDVAKYVGMSGTAFCEAFKSLTGYTATEYIRNRKLYEAALLLVQTDAKIIDIGIKCGFESHDGFTRAFKKFHGLKPSIVRKKKDIYKRFLPIQIGCIIRGGDVEPKLKILHKFETKLIGFKRFISKENEENDLKAFWKDFYNKYQILSEDKNIITDLEAAIKRNAVGEYGIRFEDSLDGFQYMIAGRFSGGDIPSEMLIDVIPESDWVVFDYNSYEKGFFDETEIIHDIQTLNVNTNIERAKGIIVEWYEEIGCCKDNGRRAIWIPVIEKKEQEKNGIKKQIVKNAKMLFIVLVVLLVFLSLAITHFINNKIENNTIDNELIIEYYNKPYIDDSIALMDYESRYSIIFEGTTYESIDEYNFAFDYLGCSLKDKIDNIKVKSISSGQTDTNYSDIYEIDGVDRKVAVIVNLGNRNIFLVFINYEYKSMDWDGIINILKGRKTS